jgi:hypothetical protein
MRVFMGRTSRLKASFINTNYLPDPDKSILTSVQVSIPQTSNTPIRQVGQRALAGNYQDLYHPATISLTWWTEHAEAERMFLVALPYFRQRAGAVISFTSAAIGINAFSYLSGASFQTQGMEPSQWSLELTFLNCPALYAVDLDPLELVGVTTEESESQITISEDALHDDLVTGKSANLTMRADPHFALAGYRSLSFGEVILAQSILAVDADYIPTWDYNDQIELATAIESFNSNLGESGPRQYSLNRQAQVKVLEPVATALGW